MGEFRRVRKSPQCRSPELDRSSDVLIVMSDSDFRDLSEIKIVDQLRKAESGIKQSNRLQGVAYFFFRLVRETDPEGMT